MMRLETDIQNLEAKDRELHFMSGKKLHFGIIGAGRIGRVHAETLAFRMPEAEIVSISDVNREAPRHWRRIAAFPTLRVRWMRFSATSASRRC